jgi:hypothetical protein
VFGVELLDLSSLLHQTHQVITKSVAILDALCCPFVVSDL